MPGFENGREELRTLESVTKDRRVPQGDGDSRPLDESDAVDDKDVIVRDRQQARR